MTHDKIRRMEKELFKIHLSLHHVKDTKEYFRLIRRYNAINSKYVQYTGHIYNPTAFPNNRPDRMVSTHD
jgi:hypothetical protein